MARVEITDALHFFVRGNLPPRYRIYALRILDAHLKRYNYPGSPGPGSAILPRRRQPSRLIQSIREGHSRVIHHASLARGVTITRPRLCRIAAIAVAATASALLDMKAGRMGACRWTSGSFRFVSSGVRTTPGHRAVTPRLSR